MRDFDGDNGRVRLEELGGNGWGNAFVGLIFEHQVHTFLDEDIDVAQGLASGVAVVHRD